MLKTRQQPVNNSKFLGMVVLCQLAVNTLQVMEELGTYLGRQVDTVVCGCAGFPDVLDSLKL